MFSKSIKYILFLLLFFSLKANCTIVNLKNHQYYHQPQGETTVVKDYSQTTIEKALELIGKALINTQKSKTSTNVKYSVIARTTPAIIQWQTIYPTQTGINSHSLFQKLIIFPFHVFW